MKKKWLAIIFAVLGGWFGLHRFYLRQPELGIFYILLYIWLSIKFFGIPLSSLIGWYDAYRLLMMGEEEFDRKYNSSYFRDRFGRRRERVKDNENRRGRYILLGEDEQTTVKNQDSYINNYKRKKESDTIKQRAIKKFKDYDLLGAIADFNQAITLNPTDKFLHFNIACAYSMIEKEYEAFYHLDQAVSNGFNEFEKILTHESLAYIRVLPEFRLFKNNNYRLTSKDLESIKNKPKTDLLEELTEIRQSTTLKQFRELNR